MRIIEFSGLQRSGNHAIIKWIANTFYSEKIDFESVDFMEKKTKLMKIKGKDDGEFLFLNQYIKNGPDGDKQCMEYINSIEPDVFIIGYENNPIRFSAFDGDVETEHIYLLRSFRNNYASFCKMKGNGLDFRWFVNKWFKYAEYIIPNVNKKGFIFYDKWLTDVDYRRRFCEKNNLPFEYDRMERDAAVFGNGSSFSGTEKELNDKDLLERYKQYNFTEQQQRIVDDVMNNSSNVIKEFL